MLFNTEKLQGMPKKIKALARREAEVSLVQQVTLTHTSRSFIHALLMHIACTIMHTHTLSVLCQVTKWKTAMDFASSPVKLPIRLLSLRPLYAVLPSGVARAFLIISSQLCLMHQV